MTREEAARWLATNLAFGIDTNDGKSPEEREEELEAALLALTAPLALVGLDGEAAKDELIEAERSSALEAWAVLSAFLGWKSGGLASAAIETVARAEKSEAVADRIRTLCDKGIADLVRRLNKAERERDEAREQRELWRNAQIREEQRAERSYAVAAEQRQRSERAEARAAMAEHDLDLAKAESNSLSRRLKELGYE